MAQRLPLLDSQGGAGAPEVVIGARVFHAVTRRDRLRDLPAHHARARNSPAPLMMAIAGLDMDCRGFRGPELLRKPHRRGRI